MPIDIEELKRKHGQGVKPQPEKLKEPIAKIIEPFIKEKKNDIKIERETISEQEIRNKLIKEIIEKRKLKKGGNMVQKEKKKPIKGNSGLKGAVNTKEDYYSLFGDNTEAQQNTQKEASIGVNQPINNDSNLLKLMDSIIPMNQGNGGNINVNNQLALVKTFLEIQKLANNPQQQGGNSNSDIIKFMAMMLQQSQENTRLMMENSDNRFQYMSQMIGGNKQDPLERFMQGIEFTKGMIGDKRAKNKDEMNYDIQKKELELKEYARRDDLDRQERQIIRDDQKSQRFMDIGGIVLDKVIGNGLGSLVNDLMSVKGSGGGKAKGKKAPTSARQDFDPSVLDELND